MEKNLTPVKNPPVGTDVRSTDKSWKVSDVSVTPVRVSETEAVRPWTNDVPPPEPTVLLYPEVTKLDWKGLPHIHCGLANLGNTCFINATVQALFHVAPFVSLIIDHQQCSVLDCSICGVRSLIIEMTCADHVSKCRPILLLSRLKVHAAHIMTGEQEDANEFLEQFLSVLDADFMRELPCDFKSMDYISKLSTPTNRILMGWLKTELRCLRCSDQRATFSPFSLLQVNIPNNKLIIQDSVQSAIDNFFSNHQVCYTCPTCTHSTSSCSYSVHKLPLVLVVQFKRFSSPGVKNVQQVVINNVVTLTGTNIKYSLNSVICHKGPGLGNGHYVTYGKCPDGKVFVFDDENIYPSTFNSEVAKTGCYLLFYTKCQLPKVANVYNLKPAQSIIRPKPSNVSILKPVTQPKICSMSENNHHPANNNANETFKKKCVSPLFVRKSKRQSPKDHSSVSSNEYAVITNTNNEKDKKIEPLLIKRSKRLMPKSHSSQSSYEYATATSNRMIVSPLVIKKSVRAAPKTYSSQSSHDYAIQLNTRKACQRNITVQADSSPNIMPAEKDFVPPVHSTQMVPQETHKRRLFHTPCKISTGFGTCNDRDSTAVADQTSERSGRPVTNIGPTHLPFEIVSKNKVEDLEMFLRSRCIPPRGLKRELVATVEGYMKLYGKNGTVCISVPRVDAQTSNQLLDCSVAVRSFPKNGWEPFPSTDIPTAFNFGRILDYLIESAPVYCPESQGAGNALEVDSGDEMDLELSVRANYVPDHWKQLTSIEMDDVDDFKDPFDEEAGFIHDVKKLRQGFKFLKSKHARNIRDLLQDNTYFVRCDMKASMEPTFYTVQIAMSVATGNIKLCECQCKGRTLRRCCHVSGLLLHIWCHIRLNGYQAITCTSRPCYWNKGSLTANPGPISKNRYDSCKLDVERRAKFDTRARRDQVTVASVQQLSSFVAFLSGNPYPTLWGIHIPLVYEDYPITDLSKQDKKALCKLSQKFLKSLRAVDPSPDVMKEVFTETTHGVRVLEFVKSRGQGDNSIWLAERALKFTASTVYKVLHFTQEKAKRSFLRDHLWGIKGNTRGEAAWLPKAIFHGKSYEKKGVEKYLEYKQIFDSTASVDDCMGLIMREDYPEFGCSPDGVVYSDYNPPCLLEIKCPFSLRDALPEDFEEVLTEKQKSTFYLWKNANGDIFLKKEHAYYYQVQFSLGIMGLEDADFVVYTLKGILVLPIQFDPVWWADRTEVLKEIHHKLLVPEYFLMRTPRNLLPFEIDIDEKIPAEQNKKTSTEEEISCLEDSSDEEEGEDDTIVSDKVYLKYGKDETFTDFLNDAASIIHDEKETATDMRRFLNGNLYDKYEDESEETDSSGDSNNSVAYSVTYDDEGNAYF